MKHLSLSALAAVGVLAGMTAANAADLGGNCCADLEERIAELEATTARKGNRKVSLTVSGWVSQQVAVWSDGVQTKAYVSDIGNTLNSNVKFTGQAKINPDWSAGYVLQLEGATSQALSTTQTAKNGGSPNAPESFGVLQSFWFVKSESLGKLSIGTQSSAADNAALLPDGSGTLVPANYILYEANGFFARKSNGQFSNITLGSLATCAGLQAGVGADCDGVPNNNIRYDTPVFGGFSASASWGESDIWAVAGRYSGEHAGFKFSAAIAYDENSGQQSPSLGAPSRVHAADLQVGAYLEHVPTGLFVYGAYDKDYNNGTTAAGKAVFVGKPDGDGYYIKGGIRQKWSPLGHTVLFGEYGNNSNKQSLANWESGITSSNIDQWGLGLVQEIDAAAMSMWFTYRNYSVSATCAAVNNATCDTGINAGLQDFQVFKAGALISF